MRQQELFDFLREYVEYFEKVAGEEPAEHASLTTQDIGVIEHSMSRRQAIIKQIENWENRRVEIQAACGFAGLSFQELLGRLDGGERERFAALFERLGRAVSQVKFLNEKSMRVVRDQLDAIARAFPEMAAVGVGEYAPPLAPKPAAKLGLQLKTKI